MYCHIKFNYFSFQGKVRHPLALAQQVLTLNDIASGRLRLGIGPSHSSTIKGIFGLSQRKPLVHLREYVEVLRAAQ